MPEASVAAIFPGNWGRNLHRQALEPAERSIFFFINNRGLFLFSSALRLR
jgi:hypothetical protein